MQELTALRSYEPLLTVSVFSGVGAAGSSAPGSMGAPSQPVMVKQQEL